MTTPNNKSIEGRVVQIIGPVIDISFDNGASEEAEAIDLPAIHDAVEIVRPDGRVLIAEIQQHIGENCVRAVAMDSTDGLRRGVSATSHYSPVRMPAGDQIKGRLLTLM